MPRPKFGRSRPTTAAAAPATFRMAHLQNCSITHLKHSGERISLSSFNETGFLAAMAALRGTENLVTYR